MTAIKTYFRHQVCKDGYKLDKIFLPKQSGPKSYELKNFKEKEIQNTKILIYEKILQKGLKIKADCVGSIKEKVDRELIIITVTYFKKYG